MSRCCTKVLLILLMVTLCLGTANYDGRCESVENLEGEEETLFEFNFKVIGRDRMLNGTGHFHVDMDEQYDVWVDISTFKNGEWIPMNLKLRTKSCDFLKNVVAKYYQKSFSKSNLPTGDDLCPLPKGEYYFKNIAFSTDNWPTFAKKGLNKGRFAFMKDGKLVGGFAVVMTLYDRNT